MFPVDILRFNQSVVIIISSFQRACEYLALSRTATLDVLATVLEEMPPFPEKESSGLLNLLKKKRPGRVPENPEIK